MIAITSISPGHKNFENQKKAVQSWKAHGYTPVSLNNPKEIEVLEKDFLEVKFIPTLRTNEVLFGKPYVLISAIIDHIKEAGYEHTLIINSDIIINDVLRFTDEIKRISEDGLVIMNRHDFSENMDLGKAYEKGFDGFFINKKWIHIFPQSILCLGQCFWDFWVPYVATLNSVNIYRLNEPYIFHKVHAIQYSPKDWESTGKIFQMEMGRLNKQFYDLKRPDQVADYTFKAINHNFK